MRSENPCPLRQTGRGSRCRSVGAGPNLGLPCVLYAVCCILLLERMLKLLKDLPKARTAPDKTAIERQIVATDKQIDQLVYELYGLTEDEIRIVEGADA